MEEDYIDNNLANELKEEFSVKPEFETNPEKFVLQTLDDAALVLTVCRMSLIHIKDPLPTFNDEVIQRLMKVSELMQAIDKDVAQWYDVKVVDSVIEKEI